MRTPRFGQFGLRQSHFGSARLLLGLLLRSSNIALTPHFDLTSDLCHYLCLACHLHLIDNPTAQPFTLLCAPWFLAVISGYTDCASEPFCTE